ncbi:hypothetical protein M9H77_34532 [Catharanthus roseus]|uniref:Uncharacterized protein n=1 Tax=Catharanthus roseus TaxID=4058 RepID=A0ACB9ZQN8_CATRO|nr:hypothetical protein M9H77_34532 [Catharanthus roseus]
MSALRGARQIRRALVLLQTWFWSCIPLLRLQLDRHVELDPCALLARDLVPFDLWLVEVPLIVDSYEIITYIWRRSMLLMWRSGIISRDSTLRMALFYPLRIYHHAEMITLDELCDNRTIVYEPAEVDRQMIKVDDMIIGVMEGPPSSPTKYGARRLPSAGACGGRAPVSPHPGEQGHADPRHRGARGGGSGGRGRENPGSYIPPDPFDSSDLDVPTSTCRAGISYIPPDPFNIPDAPYIQPPPSTGGTSYLPPPLGSSVPHMPISRASSSDSYQHAD